MAGQYALNNLILALRSLVEIGKTPSQEVAQLLRDAVGAMSRFDRDPTRLVLIKAAAAACWRLLQRAEAWMETLPDTGMTFGGWFPSVRLPVTDAGSPTLQPSQVLVNLTSGHSMPVLGFGTHCLPLASVGTAVVAALRAGFRHIDVAGDAGHEAAVGKALTKFLSSAGAQARNELFLSARLPMGIDWRSQRAVDAALRSQLESLRVDYLDLYLLPRRADFASENLREAWYRLEALVASGGRVRSAGVAGFQGRELEVLAAIADTPPSVARQASSVFDSGPGSWEVGEKDPLEQVALLRGITVVAEGVLRGGPDGSLLGVSDGHVRHIAKALGRSPAQVLLRWAMQRGMAALPCSADEAHIREDADVFGFELLEFDMAILTNLAALAGSTPAGQHRPVWRPDVFALSRPIETQIGLVV